MELAEFFHVPTDLVDSGEPNEIFSQWLKNVCTRCLICHRGFYSHCCPRLCDLSVSPSVSFSLSFAQMFTYFETALPAEKRAYKPDTEYFAWIPTYYGAIPADGSVFSWSAPCFAENKGKVCASFT